MAKERLQKTLARGGLGSRRACETLIRQGRVCVNGGVVAELGSRVDPVRDTITCDGERVTHPPMIYLALHKPRGYLCTRRDERGRKTVYSLLRNIPAGVFTVGRLDSDAEGLLLLTNDGAFSHAVAHPRHTVDKTYQLTLKRHLSEKERVRLQKGITLEGRRTLPVRIRRISQSAEGEVVRVVIREGRKRQLKKMFLAMGCPVKRIKRIAIGGLVLGDLPPGKYRRLGAQDIKKVFLSPRRRKHHTA